MSLSRAELEAMDRDELIDTVADLSDKVTDLAVTVETLQDQLEDEREQRHDAAKDRAQIRGELNELRSDLESEIAENADTLHHERGKLMRRVSTLEDEVGITTSDALAVAEGGEDAQDLSKLGRLIRHGPDAVSENPTAKMYRAADLVDNWNDWGTVRSDTLGKERRLASTKHHLKGRLEDLRGESLSWVQVYRAMQLIADWSDGKVKLKEGSDDEGKYVLVHKVEETA